MIYFDTETCGLHGPIVLLQWAEDDGPIHLHSVWTSPISETMTLIERICDAGVCAFNLSFDWFHICQLYTTLRLMSDPSADPIDCIEEYAELEPIARDGPCLKPRTAFDLMMHARKGPYQSTMDRGDIRIHRVPTALAWQLASELEARVKLKDIYFARRKEASTKWKIYDIEDSDGDIDPDFKDVVLKFHPSTALKALAVDALGLEEDVVLKYTDIEISDKMYPVEIGYAPFAKAIGTRHNWKGAWPHYIRHHISHWGFHKLAREYATKDVWYLQQLDKKFGYPQRDDDDSVLAAMVGACRWRGYKIDVQALLKLRDKATRADRKIVDGVEIKIPTAPKQARYYVMQHMDETERTISELNNSTDKITLETISKWKKDCGCESSLLCEKCKGTGEMVHPAAVCAADVLNARKAGKEIELYDKLLAAGRFHASFVVIGTLSSRMAGTDDLNPQGIKKTKDVRSCFPLAFPGYVLCGGDFSAFEVSLAEAVYNDPGLRKDLLSGLKIHALFGESVFPPMTYEQILASEGTADDKYTRSKSAVFALFYFGDANTLKERLGVELEIAEKALKRFGARYPNFAKAQQGIKDMFCSMTQPGGIGSKVIWRDPADFIESMFGFRRYFTLENRICKSLFDLANKPPKEWRDSKVRVQRRDRMQVASGAVQSALYGAAFALQGSNTRAAGNHVIQSSGAQITKRLQRRLWDLQPPGVQDWLIQPMNIHDEVMAPMKPEIIEEAQEVVRNVVEEFKPRVPLLKISWKPHLKSWADKG